MSVFGGFLFVAALLFSIGLHEAGHLATAKRFGIKATQFFIGFGPKIWSTHRGETEYGVKALPLGGFVKIAGMNPFEDIAPEDRNRVFKAKPAWQRAIVLAAGSFTHFVLAFVIAIATFSLIGVADVDRPTTTIESVSAQVDGEPSPARAAGLEAGDTIVAVQDERVSSWSETIEILKARPGKRTRITIERDGVERTVTAVLATHRPGETERVGFLGVGPTYENTRLGLLDSVGESGVLLGRGTVESLKGLASLFSPSMLSRLFGQLTGTVERAPEDPATVVGLTGTAGGLASQGDFSTFFLLIAAFNIFIGVANLLPLPPLDGGHLAVLAYEKIRGREVDIRKLIPITATVITIFGSLFLLLLVLDITQPISPPR